MRWNNLLYTFSKDNLAKTVQRTRVGFLAGPSLYMLRTCMRGMMHATGHPIPLMKYRNAYGVLGNVSVCIHTGSRLVM